MVSLFSEAVRAAVPDLPRPSQPPAMYRLQDPGTPEEFWERWSIASPVMAALLDGHPERLHDIRDAFLRITRERGEDVRIDAETLPGRRK